MFHDNDHMLYMDEDHFEDSFNHDMGESYKNPMLMDDDIN